MITMTKIRMILIVLLIALCINVNGQQTTIIGQVQKLHVYNQLLNQQQRQVIQFHEDNKQLTHIDVKQKQYGYLSEITQDYNIVHTDIYPKTQQKSKFVASLPKDNFVNKLKQTRQQIKNQESKENQQKAYDILKTQSVQQDKKIQEQNNIQQKQTISKEKVQKQQQQNIPTKQTQTIESPPKEIDKNKQSQPLQQDKIIQERQDLFIKNNKKDYPSIQKTEQKIQFKQHVFSQPLKIKNYPFEEHKVENVKKDKTQVSKQSDIKNEKQIEQKKQVKKQVEVIPQPKDKQKTVDNNEPQKNIKPQKTEQQQSTVQKQNLQIQKEKQQEKKQIEKQEEKKNQKTQQKPQQKPQSKQQQKQQQKISQKKQQQKQQPYQTQNIDQEYKKLTKMLSIDKQQLRSYLQYEDKVQDEISDRNWKFLLAKVLIWIVIAISIYQAMCSSQSRLSKAQKQKYAPVETEMFQSSRDHLEVAQTQDRK